MNAPHILFIPTRFTDDVKKCSPSCHREGKQNLNRCLFSNWFSTKRFSKESTVLCCESIHVDRLMETCFPEVLRCQLRVSSIGGNTFHPAATSIDDLQHQISDQYMHFTSPWGCNQRFISSTRSLLIKVPTYKKCWFLSLVVPNSSKTGDLSFFFKGS